MSASFKCEIEGMTICRIFYLFSHIKPFFAGGMHRLDFVILRVVSFYSFVSHFVLYRFSKRHS